MEPMHSRRSARLITMYVLSLAATLTVLVVWVVYVVRSGVAAGLDWLLLSVGSTLLFFLIVGLLALGLLHGFQRLRRRAKEAQG